MCFQEIIDTQNPYLIGEALALCESMVEAQAEQNLAGLHLAAVKFAKDTWGIDDPEAMEAANDRVIAAKAAIDEITQAADQLLMQARQHFMGYLSYHFSVTPDGVTTMEAVRINLAPQSVSMAAVQTSFDTDGPIAVVELSVEAELVEDGWQAEPCTPAWAEVIPRG